MSARRFFSCSILPASTSFRLRQFRQELVGYLLLKCRHAHNLERRQGKPIGDFRRAWKTACRAAGVPERTFHDLRRSAVRNMDRAGVSRHVAMRITGHKSESTYQRYNIVSEADLRLAAQTNQLYLDTLPLRRENA